MSYRRNLPHTPAGQRSIPYGSSPFADENRMYDPQSVSTASSRAYMVQTPVRNATNEAPIRVVQPNDLANAPAGNYIHPDAVFSLENLIDEDLEDRRPLLDRESPRFRYEHRFVSQSSVAIATERTVTVPGMYTGNQYINAPSNMRETHERKRHHDDQARRTGMYDDDRYVELDTFSPDEIVPGSRQKGAAKYQGDVVDLKQMLATGPPNDTAIPNLVISQGSTRFPEAPQLIPPFRPSSQATAIPTLAAIDLLGKIVMQAEDVMNSVGQVLAETEKAHFLIKFRPGAPKTKTLLELLEALCGVVGKACVAIEERQTPFEGVRTEETRATYDIAVDTCIRLSYKLGNIATEQKAKHRIQAVRKQMLTLLDLLGTKLRVLVLCMMPHMPRPRDSNANPNKEDDHFLGKRMRRVHEQWMEVPQPLGHKTIKKKLDSAAAA